MKRLAADTLYNIIYKTSYKEIDSYLDWNIKYDLNTHFTNLNNEFWMLRLALIQPITKPIKK